MGLVIKRTQPEHYDPIDGNSKLKEVARYVMGRFVLDPNHIPMTPRRMMRSADYGLPHAFTSTFEERYADLEEIYNNDEGLEELPQVQAP